MQKTDSYFQHYGLGKDPFPVDTFDNVLFLTPELTQRIDRIRLLLKESDKLVLVTSVNGAGKSTLADYIESIAEKNWSVCLVQATSGLDREALAHEIIQQVSPDKADEKSFAIPQLHKFLEFSSKLERQPVVIIDDADKLPVDTLEFLLELSALKYLETCYRFLLFAGENINDRLGHESLVELERQLVTRVNLPAFSRNQVKEYIDTRLSSSGEISEYPFSDEDIDNIYRVSAGLPLGINILARKHMESITSASGRSLTPRMKLISVAAIILIVIIVILTYQPDPAAPMKTVQAPQPPQVARVLPPPATPDTSGTIESLELDVSTPDENPGKETASEPAETPNNIVREEDTMDQFQAETASEIPATEDRVADAETAATNYAEGMGNNEESIADTLQDETNNSDEENTVTTALEKNMTPPASSPLSPETGVDLTDSSVTSDISAAQTTSTAPVMPGNPDATNIYQLDDIPQAITGIRGEQWFREQDGSAYTLQLISASEIDNVLDLIEGLPGIQQDLSGYVKYTPSGRPRYLLFFGIYADRDAAQAAVSDMPDKLAAVKPYARSVSSIINEIETVGSWPR